MPDLASFGVFLVAATLLAITPGPGLFYVMTRSLKGGRMEGISSALGTALGGMVHVIGAALGISVILAASALAFNLLKYLGAAYLVYLGLKTILDSKSVLESSKITTTGAAKAFRQGIVVEALNPKTALFFLAFIPQFINPDGIVFLQFIILGLTSVALNTTADFVVAALAGPIGKRLQASPKLRARQRYATGAGLIALGAYVALTGDQGG